MKKLSSIFSAKVILAIILAMFLAITALFAVMPTKQVYAGLSSSFFIESAGFNGSLSKGIFEYSTTDDVTIDSDNVIYFGHTESNTSKNTKLALRAKLNQLTEIGNGFATITLDMNIIDIPSGGTFVFAMGLPERKSNFGSNGSLEFAFTKSGEDYVLGVKKYNSPFSVSNLASGLSVGEEVKLVIDINLDGSMQIVEEQNTLTNVNIGTTMPTGYVALGYKGEKCKTKLTNFVIELADYDNPTNPGDIVENFDNNEFNANLWWSEAQTGAQGPSYAHVENNYLKISNAHKPHFTSLYQYSNLSLEFELFDFGCYTEDEDGNPIEYSSEALTVFLGVGSYTEDIYTSITRTTSLKITIGGTTAGGGRDVTEVYNRVSFSSYGDTATATMTTVNPCDKVLTDGRRTNVKIEVVDMVAKLWLKYDTDASYGQPILEMKLRSQPTGYVRFGCYGDTQVDTNGWERTLMPNFSLDSIKLKNLDYEPKICAMPTFRSNVYDTGSDWPYVDKDRDTDLLVNRLDQTTANSGCSGSIVETMGVALLTIMIAMVFVIKRRKSSNEK